MTTTEPDGRLCILVVEDEVFVRMTTVDMLEELGHETIEADTGQAALAALQSTPRIDLMLTDVGLPDIRGPELAHTCRGLRPKLPIIFATGYDGDSIVQEFGDPAGTHVLPKPFQLDDLEQALRAIIGR